MEPLNTKEIISLQNKISKNLKNFNQYEPSKLHLTLFHFGKPKELYNEIHKFHPEIGEYKEFLREFLGLLDSLQFLKGEKPIKTQPKGISFFGSSKSREIRCAVVLEFNQPEELKDLRKKMLKPINAWLKSIGVRDYPNFYKYSHNFKFNLPRTYKPHVTLGRAVIQNPNKNHNIQFKNTSVEFGNLNFKNIITNK